MDDKDRVVLSVERAVTEGVTVFVLVLELVMVPDRVLL